MFTTLIYLKNSTSLSFKINSWHRLMSGVKHQNHHLLKSVKINTAFFKKLNQMAFSVDCNHMFFKRILSTPAVFTTLFKSQLFAMHSSQWDCFTFYRQLTTSNGFFSCSLKWAKVGRVKMKDFEIIKDAVVCFFII